MAAFAGTFHGGALNICGEHRARSHYHFVPSFIRCTPDSLTYSVPLFLKRQCDRTLGEHVQGGAHYEIGTINGAMESAKCAVERWFPSSPPRSKI
jgi:hypothetical protein